MDEALGVAGIGAAKRGSPETAQLRVKKAVARLEASLAGRVARNADYIRSSHSHWAAGTFGLLFIAMADAERAAERGTQWAATRHAKEVEAKAQRRAVEYEEYGPER